MKAPFRGLLLALISIASFHSTTAHAAGPYSDLGFGLSSMSQAGNYFQNSTANNVGMGTNLKLSLYWPLIFPRKSIHIDFGIEDRLNNASSSGTSFSMNTLNAGARLEFFRFYVGIGYGFLDMAGSGITSLHTNPGYTSYFGEGGVIWRVIPEFQLAASIGVEYGSGSAGKGPSPVTDYGLHFRFPLFPAEEGKAKAVDFDGFRYPFGFMKD